MSQTKCTNCGRDHDRYGECDQCKKLREDNDDALRRMTQQSTNMAMGDMLNTGNMAMGDMLNTGIPGGIDMDFTTPL